MKKLLLTTATVGVLGLAAVGAIELYTVNILDRLDGLQEQADALLVTVTETVENGDRVLEGSEPIYNNGETNNE